MTSYFAFAIGCIVIQFAVIALVAIDNIQTAQRYSEMRLDNVRLLAMYEAVTRNRRGAHKKSGMTHSVDCSG